MSILGPLAGNVPGARNLVRSQEVRATREERRDESRRCRHECPRPSLAPQNLQLAEGFWRVSCSQGETLQTRVSAPRLSHRRLEGEVQPGFVQGDAVTGIIHEKAEMPFV